jgi:hypothetical protein
MASLLRSWRVATAVDANAAGALTTNKALILKGKPT